MKPKAYPLALVTAAATLMLQLTACSTHSVKDTEKTAQVQAQDNEIDADAFMDLFGNRNLAQASAATEGVVKLIQDVAAKVTGKESDELIAATRSGEKALALTGETSLKDLKEGKFSPALAEKIRENLEANVGGFMHSDGFKTQEARSAKIATSGATDYSVGHASGTGAATAKSTGKAIPPEALQTMTAVENGLWASAAPDLVKPIAHDYATAWNGGLKILKSKTCTITLDRDALINAKKLTGREANAVAVVKDAEGKNAPSFYNDVQRCAFKATENWASKDLNIGASYKEIRTRVINLGDHCLINDDNVVQMFRDNPESEPTIPAVCDKIAA